MVLLIAVIVYVEIWGQNWGLVKVMFGWLRFCWEAKLCSHLLKQANWSLKKKKKISQIIICWNQISLLEKNDAEAACSRAGGWYKSGTRAPLGVCWAFKIQEQLLTFGTF